MGLIKKAIIAGAVISILNSKKRNEESQAPQKDQITKSEIQVVKPAQEAVGKDTTGALILGVSALILIALVIVFLKKSRRR